MHRQSGDHEPGTGLGTLWGLPVAEGKTCEENETNTRQTMGVKRGKVNLEGAEKNLKSKDLLLGDRELGRLN